MPSEPTKQPGKNRGTKTPDKGFTDLPQHDATACEPTVATEFPSVAETPPAAVPLKSQRTVVGDDSLDDDPSASDDSAAGTVFSGEAGTKVFTPGLQSDEVGKVDPGHIVITSLTTPQGERTRYTVTKLFAEGGLGKVYLAADRDLNREVVLKEIRQQQSRDPQLLKRFLKEAQVTGQLEHPNIVPVYEMGWRPSDGQPFYTMRFVRGKTLRDLIQLYHEQRKHGVVDPLSLPRLLSAFISICNALAYAHSRGVIHRDLKPANIAVGEFGEVIVLDWGLAKLLSQPDESLSSVAVTREASNEETQAGEVMGTPGYMAPEQAKGDVKHTDTRTDIYGLGSILYTIIAGRPPHVGENTRELLKRIARGDVPTAHSVEPSAPPALSAICAKAMATRPKNRYHTVSHLAHEVERYLSDEPVSAYREPWGPRARRWIRKHRTQCRAAAATAAVLAVLATAFVWSDSRRVAQLRAQGREHLGLAQVAFSHDALPEARSKLLQALTVLGDEPALEDLRTDANQLLGQTEELLNEARAREDVQRNLAKFHALRDDALFHGTLFTGIDVADNIAAAKTAATQALQLLPLDAATGRQLADERYLADAERAAVLAGTYEMLLVLADAAVQPLLGGAATPEQGREALTYLARAEQLGIETRAWHLRRAQCLAVAEQAEAADAERKLAAERQPTTALDNFLVGDALQRGGAVAPAIEHFEQTLRLEPDHFWAHYFLAVCHLKQERPREAVAHLTASMSLRSAFGWTWLLRAYAYGQLDNFAAAEADFDRAHQLGVDDYGFYVNRSAVRIKAGKLEEATADLKVAIERNSQQYQAYVNLAEIHHRQGEYGLALEQFAKAVRRAGDSPTAYRVRGHVLLKQGKLPEALADFELAVRNGQAGSPSLAADEIERGRILHRLKRHAEALAAYDAAAAINPEAKDLHYLRADALLALGRGDEAVKALDEYLEPQRPEANALRLRGYERAMRGDAAGALADYSRALTLEPQSALARARRGWAYLNTTELALADFEKAIEQEPANSDLYNGRGYARVLLGKYQLGVEDAEQALRLGPAGKVLTERVGLYTNAAYTFAQAAGRAAQDLSVADRQQLADRYQARAVEVLAQGLDLLPASLRGDWLGRAAADPAFDPIRHSEGFKQLVAKYPPPR